MKVLLRLLAVVLASVCLTACQQQPEPEESTASWADRYTKLLQVEKPTTHPEFEGLSAELAAIRQALGDAYVYTINPMKDGKASLSGAVDGEFMLTIDGSDPAEEWGVTYHTEAQFIEAWNGQVATARSAWDDGDEQRWSVFAPIVNKEGQVVALLGIDSLVTELMTTHSEWNRDHENWNGYTDEVPGGYPETIQKRLDELKELVSQYAKQLSASTE